MSVGPAFSPEKAEQPLLRRRLFLRSALGVTSLLVLNACSPPAAVTPTAAPAKPAAEGAPNPTSAPAAAARSRISLSYSNIFGSYLPIWTAADGAYFQQQGLDAQVQLIESTKGIASLLANEIQFAAIGGSEALAAKVGGADVVVVGNLVKYWPYVFMATPEIKTVADLKDKKVGVAGFGGSADVATRSSLRRQGLEADKDYALIATGSAANMTGALVSGAVQGGLSWPPDLLKLQDSGLHQLFNLVELKIPCAISALVTRGEMVSGQKDVVQRAIDAIVQGTARARQDRAFAVGTLKKYLKIDDDHAADVTYEFFVGEAIPPYPAVSPEDLDESLALLATQNEKARGFDLNTLLDTQFVASAQQRKVGG